MPSADSTVNAEYTECFVIEERMYYAGYTDSEETYDRVTGRSRASEYKRKKKKNVLT